METDKVLRTHLDNTRAHLIPHFERTKKKNSSKSPASPTIYFKRAKKHDQSLRFPTLYFKRAKKTKHMISLVSKQTHQSSFIHPREKNKTDEILIRPPSLTQEEKTKNMRFII